MNEKQRDFIERTSERIALITQDLENDTTEFVGLFWLSEIRNKRTLEYPEDRAKALVEAMKEYGGLDHDIDCIRKVWKGWVMSLNASASAPNP